MSRCYFVTGTDTEVGKTLVSTVLLTRAGVLGLRTTAFKPVAAGADVTAQGWRNEDALALINASNQPVPYGAVNPFCLQAAIAPHIAATQQGVDLDVNALLEKSREFRKIPADFSLVEGAGGWRVPLNHRETLADFAVALACPVIMVVAMRLGCINHALMTAEAIARDGLILAGWVANQAGPHIMSGYSENLATLTEMLNGPLLGEVPFLHDGSAEQAANVIRLPHELEQNPIPL